MKKLLIAGSLLLLASLAKADLGDQITMTLIDHVQTVAQFDEQGTTRLALLDAIIQIGNYKGYKMLDLQVGFSGDTKPEPGDPDGINYLAGAMFRLDPFFKTHVTLPEHWEFLKAIEFGPGWHYDFRQKEEFWNFQVGLAFDLNPVK